jgi:hypothetical protein
MRPNFAGALAVVLALPSVTIAQTVESARTSATVVDTARSPRAVNPDTMPRRFALSINPYAVLVPYIAGDFETRIGKGGATLGIGFGYAAIERQDDYLALEAKLRYYPSEVALRGFSVAGGIGFASVRDSYERRRSTYPTIAADLSYQWLLGRSNRFVTVLGVGLKRYLGGAGNSSSLDAIILPTARTSIGYTF